MVANHYSVISGTKAINSPILFFRKMCMRAHINTYSSLRQHRQFIPGLEATHDFHMRQFFHRKITTVGCYQIYMNRSSSIPTQLKHGFVYFHHDIVFVPAIFDHRQFYRKPCYVIRKNTPVYVLRNKLSYPICPLVRSDGKHRQFAVKSLC